MLGIFSRAYWSFINLLWWTIYLISIQYLFAHFYIVLFAYYWVIRVLFNIVNTSLFGYMICKYLFPVCGLSLNFLDGVFWSVNISNCDGVYLSFFFLYCMGVWYLRNHFISEKSLPSPKTQRFTPILLKSCIIVTLTFTSLIILSQLLCMMETKVQYILLCVDSQLS